MRPRARLASLLLLIAALGTSGCGDDNPTGTATFDILINNNTTTAYNVFADTDLDNTGFIAAGSVDANSSWTLTSYIIAANYTIRLVEDGMSIDNHAFETMISSTGNDVTWTVP